MFKKEDAIKYVQDFLKACKALPIKIDRAILFGSAITGKASEYSDIDLALFSGNFTDNILQNLDEIAMINIRFPDLDIHTYPTNAYAGKGMLLDEIKRTGLEIKLI
jgi:predicted nucleotidyltransferase